MIRAGEGRFYDEYGRTLLLRGVNLGGSSKYPVEPAGATHLRDRFYDHRNVSFVGRPFPLDEADEHFARLRAWGFTFLRLLVTWEAIEHAGPGCYDEEYLNYLVELVQKAADHQIALFIDPHQDVWSRFTGGDGAPGWTLEAVGFDIQSLHPTGAALLHQEHGDPFPRMIWPTNGAKLAAATMFTLFFGGDVFAPQSHIDGEPVQQYLQRHYLAAIAEVSKRLARFDNVVGYDTMNEPLPGYIGRRDLTGHDQLLRMGPSPTPLQSMALGEGIPQQVQVFGLNPIFPGRTRRQWLNPERVRAWQPTAECIWRRHGVWEIGKDSAPHLRQTAYFAAVDGRPVDWTQDCYYPFARRFAQTIRRAHPEATIFVQSEVTEPPPRWDLADAVNLVYAPHWYDVLILFGKRYTAHLGVHTRSRRVAVGAPQVRKLFANELRSLRAMAAERLPGAPVLLGEFGIPFDMHDRAAYRTGDFSAQVRAMDRSMRAVEDALLSGTIWNYDAQNTNAHGDGWNGEDLSIFSRDQQHDPTDIHSGGRALPAVVRPYARAVAGEPLKMSYDFRSRTFEFRFRHDPRVTAPTEVFVPTYAYPDGCRVTISDGRYELDQVEQKLLYWYDLASTEHTLQIHP
ncbi:MAG: cellulase family glycosylhydrolase [Anaerolineales bacterium]|nr:cellulase family glycosylhydrolase [Anaerolineales bacterium]